MDQKQLHVRIVKSGFHGVFVSVFCDLKGPNIICLHFRLNKNVLTGFGPNYVCWQDPLQPISTH